MTVFEITMGILIIIFSIVIVAIVLFQEGKEQSMGGIITGGGADSYLSKNKSRVIDAFLARWTRFIAIMMFALVILLNIAEYLHWFGL
ncbi:MAG: preprotein translocase subunit SecG [Clostridia bacterium]|nr:preprotein translocase subunit SecG [Clostridia bacterium]